MFLWWERCLLWLWWILGIGPSAWSIRKGKGFHIRISPLGLAIGLALIIYLIYGTVEGLNADRDGGENYISLRMQTRTATAVTFCDLGTLMLAAASGVIGGALYYRRWLEVYASIARISETLGVQRKSPATLILVVISFTLLPTLCASDLLIGIGLDYEYVAYGPMYGLHLLVMGIELQIYTPIRELKKLFEVLNKRVVLVTESVSTAGSEGILPTVEAQVSGSKKRTVGLLDLSDIHWRLCRIVQDINQVFSLQLVCILISNFIHIIITPYFFFLAAAYPETYGNEDKDFLYLQIGWIVCHVYQLLLLVWPCASVTSEAAETTAILCKSLNKPLPVTTRTQIESFLQQLVHHQASFSPFGLFQLDLPVITTISGAVSTYLVILIQYQSTDL